MLTDQMPGWLDAATNEPPMPGWYAAVVYDPGYTFLCLARRWDGGRFHPDDVVWFLPTLFDSEGDADAYAEKNKPE